MLLKCMLKTFFFNWTFLSFLFVTFYQNPAHSGVLGAGFYVETMPSATRVLLPKLPSTPSVEYQQTRIR